MKRKHKKIKMIYPPEYYVEKLSSGREVPESVEFNDDGLRCIVIPDDRQALYAMVSTGCYWKFERWFHKGEDVGDCILIAFGKGWNKKRRRASLYAFVSSLKKNDAGIVMHKFPNYFDNEEKIAEMISVMASTINGQVIEEEE